MKPFRQPNRLTPAFVEHGDCFHIITDYPGISDQVK
jgi:hypothetical protein